MIKVTSTQNIIFKVNGLLTLEITPDGVTVDTETADIIKSRLGSQVSLTSVDAPVVAPSEDTTEDNSNQNHE
jgi:hypothetical protein